MPTIIEDMWDNSFYPSENAMCSNKRIREVNHYIERHKADLEKTLTDEQKVIFEKLMDNMSELEGLSERAIFVCGFKYGARITAEALYSGDTAKSE